MTPPTCIPPGQAPGGIVFHSYADPDGRLLTSSALGGLDGAEERALSDRLAAEAQLQPGERIVLVAYDGDTGQRDAEFDLLLQMVLAGPGRSN